MIDVNDIRDPQILINGLTKADTEYTFYHDETNNIRRLHVTSSGLNVAELKVFVLGGVVHEGPPRLIDIQSLRSDMRIQPNAPEIKLEHVAKGSFLPALQSTKLTTFLEWIDANGLMVHYQELDPFYWSMADIIDSIIPFSELRHLVQYIPLLKADLALVLKTDLAGTIDLMRRHSYPDVPDDGRRAFLDGLLAILERGAIELPAFNAMTLKGVLQAGRTLERLAFIQGDQANRLIDDFSIFYINRIAIFKNSHHVLDMEDTIRARFLERPLTDAGRPLTNFRFADSKAEPGVQLSDVVAGIMGKMHTYLADTPTSQVIADRASLNGVSLDNANRLSALISTSHDSNIAFLNHVGSSHNLEKLNVLLRMRS